jgi:hypothetical protein
MSRVDRSETIGIVMVASIEFALITIGLGLMLLLLSGSPLSLYLLEKLIMIVQ